MKFKANGRPRCVPLEERKDLAEENFQAKAKPVKSKKAYVKYMMALLP